jgi:LPXTG-motif cell wall-anchored protein
MNWEDGEATWDAQCGVPAEPAVGSITLDKVTAGDNQPVDTTAFTFSVVCDEATVPEAAPAIAPADPVATVATDVAQGSTCTIGETDAAGAASTSFSVDGAAGVAGPVTVTMTDAEHVIEIVATNTFACPAGQVPNGQGGCGVDACPTVEGFQADTTLCTIVENTVVTQTPTPPAPTHVAGIQVTRAAELPRTGKSTLPLSELGLGLVLLGAGALLFARDEAATA